MQHALLIGIDAYTRAQPLSGCVNDVDAVEKFLLSQQDLAPIEIRKLVARLGSPQEGDRSATLASIREELARLASDRVGNSDRVLIWYSGHGVQVQGRAGHEGREALVPADFGPDAPLLWDVEINRALHAIAARTPWLTVVLDACCSAGTFRTTGAVPRTFALTEPVVLPEPEARRGLLQTLSGGPFAVAAAAQADQEAKEMSFGDRRHGVFTRALLDVLATVPPGRVLTTAWGELWQRVLAAVTARSANQSPVLIGRFEQPVFSGPAVPRDLGFAVRATERGWEIAAGTLAGVAPGARVAVYAPDVPAHFPTLDSAEDLAARLGVIEVSSAMAASALGEPEGALAAPEGARGRLVTPGRADRLRVHTIDAAAASLIESLPWVERSEDAEIEIGRDEHGLWLGDGRFGRGDLAPLARVDSHDALRAALDHARSFVAPLRLTSMARALPGAIALTLRDGSTELGGEEIPRDPSGSQTWVLPEGTPFVLEIANTSGQRLYVSVLNCASSGRIELLTDALEIPPAHQQIVWAAEQIGQPFSAQNRPERAIGLERIVVVGTTWSGLSLRAFEDRDTFADVIERGSVERELLPATPAERWTARVYTIRIERGGAERTALLEQPLPSPPPYERDEADPGAPQFAPATSVRESPLGLSSPLPFSFDNSWLIPIEEGQAVSTGWLPRWGSRPMGVTWHWGATTSLQSLSATLGGANAERKGDASAHYGIGRSYAAGVHRYVLVQNHAMSEFQQSCG